jgi:L-ascorbate metabolism protein UlaG (beta-lactamase superfamily)
MCFVDPEWAATAFRGLSRRHFLGTGLAAGLTAAAMDWGKSFLLPGLAEGAEPSMGPTKKFAVPGHLFAVPAAPTTVGDMPEGDSLIYLITIEGQFSIFLMSTANFIERAIAGLEPDVALVASIFANQIHHFTPRLLKALNYPKVILPTHWDNFERPYSEPPQDLRAVFGDPANLDLWVKEVKQLSPKSQVVVLKFFESFTP